MKINKAIKLLEYNLAVLGVEYKSLSELSDYFPKNSKHKAAIYIDVRMVAILKRDKLIRESIAKLKELKRFNIKYVNEKDIDWTLF
jgi:hypothetical protein